MMSSFEREVEEMKKNPELKEFIQECESKIREQRGRQIIAGKCGYSVHMLVKYVPLTQRQKKAVLLYLSEKEGSGLYGMTSEEDFIMIRLLFKYYIFTLYKIELDY